MSTHSVSVIIPVGQDHSNVDRCIRMFREQTWPKKQLIMVFDDDDWKLFKHKETSNIVIEGLYAFQTPTIGRKLNFGCLKATGEVIVRMDSDDLYGTLWIESSVLSLIETKADLVGLSNAYFLNSIPEASINDIYEYTYMEVPGKSFKVCGATMCFYKKVWAKHQFENTSFGEDRLFCEAVGVGIATHNVDKEQFLSIIHGGNTCSHKQLPYMRKLTEREQEMLLRVKIGESLTFGDMGRNAGFEL
jgi:glycosyltransferase involved in cell wall biosynthesis